MGARVTVIAAGDLGTRLRVDAVDADEWKRLLAGKMPGFRDGDRAALARLAGFSRFAAQPGQFLPWSGAEGTAGLVVGRDSKVPVTQSLRSAAALAAQQLADGSSVGFVVSPGLHDGGGTTGRVLIGAIAEGLLLSDYGSRRSNQREAATGSIEVAIVSSLPATQVTSAIERARALVAGVLLARELVNAPAQELGPAELADAAVEVARRHGYGIEVIRGADVERRGFRMVAAVGRASAKPATVTLLRRCPSDAAPAVALVGKGVTFDSGGLSIKPADSMELMRKDMAGAATILGALDAIGRCGIELSFVAALPSAENMIGPDAFRPGDVLTAYNGITVEIGNTDAEGRLLLADALAWAREQNPLRMIDYATLTGAARVALGPDLPALFASDDGLAAAVESAAREGDEPVWRLPLWNGYERALDSPFADVNHVGSEKRAGAILAALFLRRFTGGLPWAHVDLYGWEDRGRPEAPRGANGMGVRTLFNFAERLADRS
ncbi:MAG: leucyl aminopeptidase family protein [Planctomycetes bacterium]|nr:leucyl aminopeptidase family protein [Planctomycetota bacterium]